MDAYAMTSWCYRVLDEYAENIRQRGFRSFTVPGTRLHFVVYRKFVRDEYDRKVLDRYEGSYKATWPRIKRVSTPPPQYAD